MHNKILICTDGSELSGQAETYGIALARTLGASVVAVTVTSPIHGGFVGEAMVYAAYLKEEALRSAKTHLRRVARAAKKAGVAVETVHMKDVLPSEGIVATARAKDCDLIVMASHGWRGMRRLILGSETQQVITHADVPVLVFRKWKSVEPGPAA